MEPELHRVTEEELPVLHRWLTKYLPDSYKMYGTLNFYLEGKWPGMTYYTLGWPDILAVGEGPMDATKCECAISFNETQHTSVFSPNPAYLETLLKIPSFLDWTRPIVFVAIPSSCCDVVEHVSKETSVYGIRHPNHLMIAYPGDIQPRPIPDGYEIRPLDPDLHAEYVVSTWPHRRKNSTIYIHTLIKHLPTVGLFDKSNNECIGLEVTTECAHAGMLFVREEARRRGLGKVVASHMAQSFFNDNRPVIVTVLKNNQPSIDLHLNVGFKIIGSCDWFIHKFGSERV